MIEEQERSCEETSSEKLKSLQKELDSVAGGIEAIVNEGGRLIGDVVGDDEKTPVNVLFAGGCGVVEVHNATRIRCVNFMEN